MINLNKALHKNSRLIMLLSCSLISTAAIADKINRVTVTLPGAACKAVTYNNGQGTIQKDNQGNYVLTNYDNYTTRESVNYTYTCWNIKGEAPSLVDVVNLSGSFAYIDPRAWFNRVFGGIRFQVDNQSAPCDYLLSVAYITSPNYKWCSYMANMGSSGGKDGLNNWWVNTPSISIDGSWQSIDFVIREWDADQGDWYKFQDGISLSVIQAYAPFSSAS